MSTKTIDDIGGAFEAFKKSNDERLEALEKGQGVAELEQKVDKINQDLSAALDQKKVIEETAAAVKRLATVNEDLKEEKGVDLEVYGSALKKAVKANFDLHAAGLTDHEMKLMSSEVGPDGGYTVMPFLDSQLEKIAFDSSPIRSLASVVTIGTNEYKKLLDDTQPVTGWVGENGARALTDEPELGEVSIPVNTLYARPSMTEELLEDSSLNLESWLGMAVSDEFGRAEATAMVTGNGVKKPRGLTTYTAKTSSPEAYTRGEVGTLVAAGTGAVTSDELVTLRGYLKGQYRPNAYIAFNRATEAAVRKLKDGQANYLWQPSYQMGEPDSLIGQRVAIFEDLPDMAANAVSILLADFRKTYTIVDRKGISVLKDPFSQIGNGLISWYIRKRLGAGIVNFDSIKQIKMAAS